MAKAPFYGFIQPLDLLLNAFRGGVLDVEIDRD
jgi:hypothetical protein